MRDEDTYGVDRPTMNALADIGLVLTQTQLVERVIREALMFVIRDDAVRTFADAIEHGRRLDKRTAGQMVKIVRERVDLDDDFDEVLTAYVNDRNTLAHDLSRIEGFDLRTAEGRMIAGRFLRNLSDNAIVVLNVFASLILSWQETAGIDTGMEAGVKAMIGAEWEGIAERTFFAKASDERSK